MAEDRTATRITFYLASIWMVLGEMGLFDHFHHRDAGSLVIAGVAGVAATLGFVVVTWVHRVAVKLVAEPLTMVGVVASAVGFFFHPYAWLTITVGVIILFAFGVALYDERKDREEARKARQAKAIKVAQDAAAAKVASELTKK